MTLRWLMEKLGYVPKADLDAAKEQAEKDDQSLLWQDSKIQQLTARLALHETPHKHPVCVSCSKPVKRGQKYTVKFVKHEDCGGNNGE